MSFSLNDLEGRLEIVRTVRMVNDDVQVWLHVDLSPEEFNSLKSLLEKDK